MFANWGPTLSSPRGQRGLVSQMSTLEQWDHWSRKETLVKRLQTGYFRLKLIIWTKKVSTTGRFYSFFMRIAGDIWSTRILCWGELL